MNRTKGFTLVELVVAVAIIVLFLSALVAAFNLYLRGSTSNSMGTQAAYLAEEGLEAVRIMRDNGWTANIASLSTTGTTYYLLFQNSTWKATTTSNMVDSTFLRSFQVSSVNRNASGDIDASGTLDTNTKKFTVTVSWYNNGTTTKSLSTYLTNLNND